MKRACVFAIALAASTAAPSASASTLTNRSSSSFEISIVENRATTVHVLKPGKALKDFCQNGCVIRINGDVNDEYELEGSESVMLKNGYVYYDGPSTPRSAARRDLGRR